jgi:nicotinamide-nucleotide amidase
MIENNDSIALFFPGIPRELVPMLREQGVPRIQERFGTPEQVFGKRTLKVYGLSESKLYEMLADVAEDQDGYHLAFLPRFPIIRLRIDVGGANSDEVADKLDATEEILQERLKENIISNDGREMEEVVIGLLESRGFTLGLAESITGGMIGEMITRVAGSSAVFMGSIVSYSNDMKTRLLGVSEETLENYGAVSHQCAREMAVGAAKACNTDVAISVTGIAGPDGGTPEKPVGTFFLGLTTPETTLTRGFLLPGQRGWVKSLAAMQALDLLRRHLLGYRIYGSEDNGA